MHDEAASLRVSWCVRMLMHCKQRNRQTSRAKTPQTRRISPILSDPRHSCPVAEE